MESNIATNSGLIITAPLPKDYMMGSEASLGVAEVMPSGDWTPYKPQGEDQYGQGWDSMSCTSFSYTNTIETYINFLISSKKIGQDSIKWLTDKGYIDSNGTLNFSDRFLAIMSGTTQSGNALNKVAETARTVGLIPQSMLPFGGNSWNEFMNADLITKQITDLGKEFLTRFKLSYEWVMFNQDRSLDANERKLLQDSLKQLPLQVGIPFPASHAIEMIACFDDLVRLFDTYAPYQKDKTTADGNDGVSIHFAMRHQLQEVAQVVAPVAPTNWSYTYTITARKGDRGNHIIAIQKGLASLGFFKAEYAPVFGQRTFDALVAYQTSVGLPHTGFFGNMTIAKFNEKFAPKKNP